MRTRGFTEIHARFRGLPRMRSRFQKIVRGSGAATPDGTHCQSDSRDPLPERTTYASFSEDLRPYFWEIFIGLTILLGGFVAYWKVLDACHVTALGVSADAVAYIQRCDTAEDVIVSVVGLAAGIIILAAVATGVTEVVALLMADMKVQREVAQAEARANERVELERAKARAEVAEARAEAAEARAEAAAAREKLAQE